MFIVSLSLSKLQHATSKSDILFFLQQCNGFERKDPNRHLKRKKAAGLFHLLLTQKKMSNHVTADSPVYSRHEKIGTFKLASLLDNGI